jgi:hypothetical protein
MSSRNIVHQYFKKESPGVKILVKIDPINWRGTSLSIPAKGETEVEDLEADPTIIESLKAQGFSEVNAMEFNLYDSGLL